MGKKKKKSKEELEAERLIKEEEERLAREAAEKAAEEERLRLAEEHRLRQEFLLKSRQDELARLVQEEEENKYEVEGLEAGIAGAVQNLLEAEDWERFQSCVDRPDPLKEAEINTFMRTWRDDTDGDLKRAMRECTRAEEVCKEATTHLARSRAAGDAEKVAYFEKYMGLLRDVQLEKLDFATANVMKNAEEYANDKRGCQVAAQEGDLRFGIWINLAMKPFRLKVVDYRSTGIVTDIPKPCSLQSVAIRTLYLPFTHIKGLGSYKGTEVPIGGVLHLDMLRLPKAVRRVKEWEMSRVSSLSAGVERMHYPPGASPADHAASLNAQPFRIKVTMPQDLVVQNEPVVAYWDNGAKKWSSEGVAEVVFEPTSRLLSFHTTKLTPIAIIQQNHIDLPFERWSITPTRLGCATATFEAKRFAVNVAIEGSMCTLVGPIQPELQSLIGKAMEPGQLFTELSLRGINLCPKDDDAGNCLQEGQQAPICVKNSVIEQAALNDISRIAGAFGVASSVWNQQRGTDKIVFRVIEKCATFSEEGEGEVPPTPREEGDEGEGDEGEKEEEEWNTVLYEMDAQTTELETVVTEPVISNQVRCTIVAAQESDSEWNGGADPGALSHAYLKYCFQGKCTPEAEEVVKDTSAEYVSTIRSLLRLTRVLSFA
jgi:cancer susceptibility candidate protein 1